MNGINTFKRNGTSWIIFGITAAITSGHYLIPTDLHHYHEIFRRLYYIPIILGVYRYGLRGGLLISLVVSLFYLPHIIFQWAGSFLNNLVRFTEIILYFVVGGLAGFLSQKVKDERDRYRIIAEKLEISINKLERQTEQLTNVESQLRTADRLAVLGELSASLAHEVRNPLGAIKGAVDILMKRCSEDETSREFSQILQREVCRLNEVVDNYLNLAGRAVEGAGSAVLQHISKIVIQLLGPEIRKKHIQVNIDFPDKPLRLSLSEIELQQVLLNLLLNSLDAVENNGQIQMRGKSTQDQNILVVSDNGRGIADDKISTIFQPFYSDRDKGTGLGLSITKRIVESSGGSIEVDSQQGEGSEFILTFPNDSGNK